MESGFARSEPRSWARKGILIARYWRFTIPALILGVAAQGIPWQQLANDDIELLTTRPDRDRPLLPLATRFMHESEESTGLVYRSRPRLKVYGTIAEFRNSTGEPGWVAASTRGRTIQLQPTDLLRDAGTWTAPFIMSSCTCSSNRMRGRERRNGFEKD